MLTAEVPEYALWISIKAIAMFAYSVYPTY